MKIGKFSLIKRALSLTTRQRGAGLVEYGLLVGLIGVALLLAISEMGNATKNVLCHVVKELVQITGKTSTTCGDVIITLSPSEKTWEYGDTTAQIFTLENTGSQPTTSLDVSLLLSSSLFTVDSSACVAGIAAGATCSVSVTPTGTNGSDTLSVIYEGKYTTTASLKVNERAIITVTPTEKTWDYNDLTAQTFTFTNVSADATVSLSTVFSGSSSYFTFDGSGCAAALAPAHTCSVSVTPVLGIHNETATVTATYVGAAAITIPVTIKPMVSGLYALGNNGSGQTGGTDLTSKKYSWTLLDSSSGWDSAMGGSTFGYAFKSGKIFGIGGNAHGQTGGTDLTNKTALVAIPSDHGDGIPVIDSDWKIIAKSGGYSGYALKNDGTVWGIGYGLHGEIGGTEHKSSWTQIGIGNAWKTVSAGLNHAYALQNDGKIFGIGQNLYGQIGDSGNKDTWTVIKSDHGDGNLVVDTDWVAVSAGNYHGYAIKSDGTIWGIGYNAYSQLGGIDTSNKTAWTQIEGASDWKSVSAGGAMGYALKTDGTLWGIGYNFNRQLGGVDTTNKTTWTQIGNDTWSIFSGGNNHGIGLKSDGTIWAIGLNNHGQTGGTNTASKNVLTQVGNGTGWKWVGVGQNFNYAYR